MRINSIIDSAYTSLLDICKNNNVINEGKTCEDYINDIVLQSLKKYKGKSVSWEEGYKYLTDNIFLELHFAKKRFEPLQFEGGPRDLPEYGITFMDGDF